MTGITATATLLTPLHTEPVAAAMAYGYGTSLLNQGNPAAPDTYDTLLVFDLGGGTFDVSVLEGFEGILEVRARVYVCVCHKAFKVFGGVCVRVYLCGCACVCMCVCQKALKVFGGVCVCTCVGGWKAARAS